MRGAEKTGVILRTLAGLLGCLCCASLAWSHGAEDSHRNRLQRTIAPDDSYELCLPLAPGQQLHYAFSASHKLDFNVHFHADHEVFYPVSEEQINTSEATFTAQSAQEYCLMWTNPGDAEVQLSLEYEKPQPTGR
jgi:hypothetical protein